MRIKHPRLIILFIFNNFLNIKRSVHLPLYHEFLELFDNHEIQNWQAKQFWEKLNISQHNRTEKTKRLMYSGLRVLMQLQYLEVDPLTSKKNTFSYTETPRMNELRSRTKIQRLKETFSKKKLNLLIKSKIKKIILNF